MALLPAEIAWAWHKTPALFKRESPARVSARHEAAAWLAATSRPDDVLFAYEPLYLAAWEADRPAVSRTVVPRADPKLALQALQETEKPLGRGVWIFDAGDNNNYVKRTRIELRLPFPRSEFEGRVYGPYLVIRTRRPTVTIERYLDDARKVELIGKSLAMGDADINYATIRRAQARLVARSLLQRLLVAGRLLEGGQAGGRPPAGATLPACSRQRSRGAEQSAEEERAETAASALDVHRSMLAGQCLDASGRPRERRSLEDERHGVRDVVKGRPVEVSGPGRRVQRIAHRNLVTDDEHALGSALDDAGEACRVPPRRLVEALPARERPPAPELPLDLAVAGELRPSSSPIFTSSSNGSTSTGTARPASASSAVSRVRGKRVWTHRSSSKCASCAPSRRASVRPSSVSGASTAGRRSPAARRSASTARAARG